jgi:hypothetical protein
VVLPPWHYIMNSSLGRTPHTALSALAALHALSRPLSHRQADARPLTGKVALHAVHKHARQRAGGEQRKWEAGWSANAQYQGAATAGPLPTAAGL